MIDTLALDSSAAIDLFSDRPPEIVKTALRVVLPLPVVGELRFGAMNAAPEWRTGLLERLDQMIDRAIR